MHSLRRSTHLVAKTFQKGYSLNLVPRRPFSKVLRDAEKNLVQSLNSEIQYEEAENTQEESEFSSEFLSKGQWTANFSEDSTKMTLKKQVDRTTVTVLYHARVPEDPENEMKEENENEKEEDFQSYVEFQVILDNHNNKEKLVADLISFNGEINVNGLFLTENADAVLNDKPALDGADVYTGPSFESLDERIQDNVLDYLKGLGVNEDLAVFIETTSYEQEGRLYLKWLRTMKDFLE